MELEYNLLNILTLFGAIQGFILCALLFGKRRVNRMAVNFFILFLFSLAFYNLMYACLDMNVFQYYRALHVFPYPFKWLIGVGFYFYVKNHFDHPEKISFHTKEWYLFIPAIVYLLLRIYWFTVASIEGDYRIIGDVVDTNFFRIQEYFILFFNGFLLFKMLNWLKNKQSEVTVSKKNEDMFKWLKSFALIFLGLTILNFVSLSYDLIINNGRETFNSVYPILIANALFIYWIGFVGFRNPSRFAYRFSSKLKEPHQKDIEVKLIRSIEKDKVFKRTNLSLHTLAIELEISSKELSRHINEAHGMNFSEFINVHRIEHVKKLLLSEEGKKYTLVSLAEMAGFNSKSSFNASFKKHTGMTPSEFKENR